MSRNAEGAKVYKMPGNHMTEVQRAITRHFQLSLTALLDTQRSPNLVLARHIAWYLERERGASFPSIGALYNRDHTSIVAGVNHMKERVAIHDERYMHSIEAVRAALAQPEETQPVPVPHESSICPTCGTSVFELHRQIALIHRRLSELGVKQ